MDSSATTARSSTRILRGDERRARWVKEIIENDFDSKFPDEDSANIVVDGENDGMVTVELLLRANLWWVAKRHRGTPKASVIIRRMAKYLLRVVPKGQSIVVVASTPSQERLCQKIGLRRVEGTMYRIDR